MVINSSFSRKNLPDNIVSVLNRANVFYSENYFQYLKINKKIHGIKCTPVYIYSDNYILLVNLHEKLIFRFASLPVEYLPIGNRSEDASEFLYNCMNYLKKKFKVHWTSASNASAFFDVYPISSKRIPFGSHIIDLTDSEDDIWSKIHSKHRNSIRKAEKSEIKIQFGGKELLDTYILMDHQTWNRSGRSGNSKTSFDDLFDTMKDNILLCLAIKDNIPQGGAIFIYNEAMSYYLFAATKNHPESGSMNLLHWKTIQYFKNIGIQKYSFVGCRINEDENSKYHDIQRFKERFGGNLYVGYMFKSVFNEPMYKLYAILSRIRGARSSDPIDQEISKWKDLNR